MIENYSKNDDNIIYLILSIFPIGFILISLLLDSPRELFYGLKKIILSHDILKYL